MIDLMTEQYTNVLLHSMSILSLINLFLFYKLLKKTDTFEMITSDAVELLNNDRLSAIKQLNEINKKVRISNNETKRHISDDRKKGKGSI